MTEDGTGPVFKSCWKKPLSRHYQFYFEWKPKFKIKMRLIPKESLNYHSRLRWTIVFSEIIGYWWSCVSGPQTCQRKGVCLSLDLSILSNSLGKKKKTNPKPTFVTVVAIISSNALAASLVFGENTSAAFGAVLHPASSYKIKSSFYSMSSHIQ